MLTAAGYYCYPFYLAGLNNNQPFAKLGTYTCSEAFWQYALWQYLRNTARGRRLCDELPELQGLSLDDFQPFDGSGRFMLFVNLML